MLRSISFSLIMFLVVSLTATGQAYQVNKANTLYASGLYGDAITMYKKAYSRVPAENEKEVKGYLSTMIARSYKKRLQLDEAKQYFDRAVLLDYQKIEVSVLYEFGIVLKMLGEYDQAISVFKQYAEFGDKSKGNEVIAGCKTAQQLAVIKTRYQVNIDPVLSTENYDFGLVYTSNRYNESMYSSNRPGGNENKKNQRTLNQNNDIWTVGKSKAGNWSAPFILGENVNTSEDEGAICLDSHGKTMYFTRCITNEKTCSGCDIYQSDKRGSGWTMPELIELKPNGEKCWSVGHPALTPNGKYLVFSSDMPGGYGGQDLWISEYDRRAKKWLAPENLGPVINSHYNEMFPTIRNDGTLYLASDRHEGMGGLDIYKCVLKNEIGWDSPENMGTPLNSSMDDFGIIFEGKSERGYLTSNRKRKTFDDLYMFNLPPITISLDTYVLDKDSKEPVSDTKVVLVGSNGSTDTAYTDLNGFVRFETRSNGSRYIEENSMYTIIVHKENQYLKGIQEFSTVGIHQSKRFIYEFLLRGRGVMVLPEVRYDFAQSTLQVNDSVNSKDSLNYLFEIMINNPTIVVELRSHTDCRGMDDFNLRLSSDRAQTCVDYLVNVKGIAKERLVPVGKGETLPLNGLSCSEIDRLPSKLEQEVAHQRNRRTDFRIISWDYYP